MQATFATEDILKCAVLYQGISFSWREMLRLGEKINASYTGNEKNTKRLLKNNYTSEKRNERQANTRVL